MIRGVCCTDSTKYRWTETIPHRIESRTQKWSSGLPHCDLYGVRLKGNKVVGNPTYSVNQSATPKQQEKEALKYTMDMEDKIKYGYDFDAEKMSFEDFAPKLLESVKDNIAHGTYTNYQHFLVLRF